MVTNRQSISITIDLNDAWHWKDYWKDQSKKKKSYFVGKKFYWPKLCTSIKKSKLWKWKNFKDMQLIVHFNMILQIVGFDKASIDKMAQAVDKMDFFHKARMLMVDHCMPMGCIERHHCNLYLIIN